MCENKENCLPRDAPRARAAARPTTKSDRRSGVRPAFDRSVSRPFRSSLKPVAKGTGDRSEDPEILLLAVEALAERRPNRRGVVIAPRAPRRPRRRGERRRSFARARARGRKGGRARSRTRVLARGDGRDRRSSEDQIPNVHRAAVDDRGPTTDRSNERAPRGRAARVDRQRDGEQPVETREPERGGDDGVRAVDVARGRPRDEPRARAPRDRRRIRGQLRERDAARFPLDVVRGRARRPDVVRGAPRVDPGAREDGRERRVAPAAVAVRQRGGGTSRSRSTISTRRTDPSASCGS